MTPEVTALVRFRRFLETMALWRMFPVGKDFEVTFRYWVEVPRARPPVEVRAPKPRMLAVPCDITVLKVPDFVLMGILRGKTE